MKKIISVAILFLTTLSSPFLSGQSLVECGLEGYNNLKQKAQRNYRNGDLFLALDQFRAARACQESQSDYDFLDKNIKNIINEIKLQNTRFKQDKENAEQLLRTLEDRLRNEIERREVPQGRRGQEYNHSNFMPLSSELHFVQFGSYQSNIDLQKLKAPPINKQAWLIYHIKTQIKGNKSGAYYMVQPFNTPEAARQAVSYYKQSGVCQGCWYNKELSGGLFLIKGITP